METQAQHRFNARFALVVACILGLLATATIAIAPPQASAQTDRDSLRSQAVTEAIIALETHAAANYTIVPGGGSRGGGQGWFYYERAGSTYPTSVRSWLVNEGFLAPTSTMASNTWLAQEFMTYRCNDRVAVFSQADDMTTAADDAAWWAANDCTTAPIDRYNTPYFELTGRLVDLVSCDGKPATIAGSGALTGTNGDDVIVGSLGADTIRALSGNDTVCAGGGNDRVWGGNGNDHIDGGDGNDLIWGNKNLDTLIGGEGNDTLDGGSHNDRIFGDAGDDTLRGSHGVDRIEGADGDDTIDGGTLNDVLIGGPGDDTINGRHGNDTIRGNSGNDTIIAGDGADDIIGSTGDDTIEGGPGDDTINGSAGADTINGGNDNDTVDGGTGWDTINGGPGDDTLRGGDGVDTIDGGNDGDQIEGGEGADVLNGGPGDDTVIGGDDNDRLDGGSGADRLEGRDGDDFLQGSIGNDVLHGGTGDDVIYGGADDDTVEGGPGSEWIFGEDGSDTLNGGNDGDLILGGAGNDTVNGGPGDDTLMGGPGDDVLNGGHDDDAINGEDGDDQIHGGNDADEIDGGPGDDTLNGGLGDDKIIGNGGIDSANGSLGNDKCQVETRTNCPAVTRGWAPGASLTANLVSRSVVDLSWPADADSVRYDLIANGEVTPLSVLNEFTYFAPADVTVARSISFELVGYDFWDDPTTSLTASVVVQPVYTPPALPVVVAPPAAAVNACEIYYCPGIEISEDFATCEAVEDSTVAPECGRVFGGNPIEGTDVVLVGTRPEIAAVFTSPVTNTTATVHGVPSGNQSGGQSYVPPAGTATVDVSTATQVMPDLPTTPPEDLGACVGLTIHVAEGSVYLNWSPAANADSYRIAIRPLGGAWKWTETYGSSAELTGVRRGFTYEVKVFPQSASGSWRLDTGHCAGRFTHDTLNPDGPPSDGHNGGGTGPVKTFDPGCGLETVPFDSSQAMFGFTKGRVLGAGSDHRIHAFLPGCDPSDAIHVQKFNSVCAHAWTMYLELDNPSRDEKVNDNTKNLALAVGKAGCEAMQQPYGVISGTTHAWIIELVAFCETVKVGKLNACDIEVALQEAHDGTGVPVPPDK